MRVCLVLGARREIWAIVTAGLCDRRLAREESWFAVEHVVVRHGPRGDRGGADGAYDDGRLVYAYFDLAMLTST